MMSAAAPPKTLLKIFMFIATYYTAYLRDRVVISMNLWLNTRHVE